MSTDFKGEQWIAPPGFNPPTFPPQYIAPPALTGVWIAWTWEGNGYLVKGIWSTAAEAAYAFGSDGYTHIGFREFGEL